MCGICSVALVLAPLLCLSQTSPTTIEVSWEQVEGVSKTTITVQDCPEPPLLRKAPTHVAIYKALRELNADYARLQPWFPYPKISVAELKPPHDGQTFWDFKLMDEVTEDFMEATKGHSVVFDLGTIPTWMFKTKSPVQYPSDPEVIDWDYDQGTVLRDPTLQEVADYQECLVSWYIKGGFSDEFGKWHASGHHFKIDYWEVLNEVDLEHNLSPELYTKIYDAVVEDPQGVARDEVHRYSAGKPGWPAGMLFILSRSDTSQAPNPDRHDFVPFLFAKAGVPGTEMLANAFEDSEVWAIISYLRSLAPSKQPVAGNLERGQQIFAHSGCPQCHMVKGHGGLLGPDLSRVGASRSVSYLTDSLREPSKDLSDGMLDPNNHWGLPLVYDTVTIITGDGHKLTGVAAK